MKIINPFTALVVGVLAVANALKTLVISSPDFPNQFKCATGEDLLRMDDVIFLRNNNSLSSLSDALVPHRDAFDRAIVGSHGSSEATLVPGMYFNNRVVRITQLIDTLNQRSNRLEKIHLYSCYIGRNFDKIINQQESGIYYQQLQTLLRDNQVLFLHGDAYVTPYAPNNARTNGIIQNKDYSIFEMITDSGDAINVVTKNPLQANSLQAFAPKRFGQSGEECTKEELLKYLNQASNQAKNFEVSQNILGEDVERPQVGDWSDEKTNDFLYERSLLDWMKVASGKTIFLPGCDINLQNSRGMTVLMNTASGVNYKLAELLLKQKDLKINLQDRNGRTALMHAVTINNDPGMAELLLKQPGIDPNLRSKFGVTALMYAVLNNKPEMAKLLLNHHDVNPNLQYGEGVTALIYAASKENYEMVELLLNHHGIDPNLQDAQGRTALIYAATAEKGPEIVKLLLKQPGIDLEIRDRDGLSASEAATKYKLEEIAALINEEIQKRQFNECSQEIVESKGPSRETQETCARAPSSTTKTTDSNSLRDTTGKLPKK